MAFRDRRQCGKVGEERGRHAGDGAIGCVYQPTASVGVQPPACDVGAVGGGAREELLKEGRIELALTHIATKITPRNVNTVEPWRCGGRRRVASRMRTDDENQDACERKRRAGTHLCFEETTGRVFMYCTI